jgi:transaldolase
VIRIEDLRIKIFADGADLTGIATRASDHHIKGFTTNPTLMRKAGVNDYRAFAREALRIVRDHPISFEVFSDDLDVMHDQAREIASWGPNVYVKIPVTNTERRPSYDLVGRLSADGIKVNVTAVMTVDQIRQVAAVLSPLTPSCLSVFAGRIADTGRDPLPIMTVAVEALSSNPHAELIWASPREVLNIVQADAIGCDIITVTDDILRKLDGLGRDLDDFSLDTVKMFHDDAAKAAYTI